MQFSCFLTLPAPASVCSPSGAAAFRKVTLFADGCKSSCQSFLAEFFKVQTIPKYSNIPNKHFPRSHPCLGATVELCCRYLRLALTDVAHVGASRWCFWMSAGDVMRHICWVPCSSSFDHCLLSNPPIARRTHLSSSATSSWREGG